MKSVVICGSSSFASEMREFANKLKELGVIVYEPHLYRASGGIWSEIKESDRKYVALGLTHDHFYKMRMADVIYVYNKDGYAGVSTNMEIGYAAALNKPIYGQSAEDAEPCRQVLFSGIVKNPEDLIAYLN
jgi:hypothetical protein